MYDEILALLDSSDPQERLRGVKRLARTEDPDVLRYLSAVVKTDPDEEVRDMARKAGRFIMKKQQEMQSGTPFMASPVDEPASGEAAKWVPQGRREIDLDDGPQLEKRKSKREQSWAKVSERQAAVAKGHLDQAMDRYMKGERTKAVVALRKAFTLNPNLQNDDYAMALAGDILGLSREEIIEELLYSDESTSSGGKRKRKIGEPVDDGTTWNQAMIQLGLYGLVVAVITFAGGLVVIQLFGELITNMVGFAAQNDPEAAMMMSEMQMGLDAFFAASVIGLLVNGILAAIFGLIGLLIWYGVVHMSATLFMSGEGSYRRLIVVATPFNTVVLIVQTVVYIVLFYVGFNGLSDLMMSYDGTFESELMISQQINTGLGLIQLVSLLFGLGVMIYYGKIIGDAYRFGMGKGCATMAIGTILLTMVIFACSCGFGFLITNMFSSMMGASFT